MKKILIIDDEKNILFTLEIFLKKEKFKVLKATNGIDGLKTAQEENPDLILLDIILPGLDGYLVCEALKQNVKTRDIPVVFISAKSQDKDIRKAVEVGATDYIVKPFTYKKIKKIINKYTGGNK